MGKLRKVAYGLEEIFESFDWELKPFPVIIITDRTGNKYAVQTLNFDDCIKDNHLVFSAYYKDGEAPDEGSHFYSIALPLELYAGIELHTGIPKSLQEIHKKGSVGFQLKDKKTDKNKK